MSLINQMLQDLERRRASGGERGALPNQVRVLPDKEKTGLPLRLAGMAGALALIAVFGWRLNNHPPSQLPAPIAQASAPLAAPAHAKLIGPTSRLSLELERAPDARAVPDHGAASPPDAANEPSPQRKTVALEVPIRAIDKSPPAPLPTAAVIASSTAVTAKSVPIPVKTEPVKTLGTAIEVPASTTVATKLAGSELRMVDAMSEPKVHEAARPQIDKRAQTLTAQQLAENDYRDAANFLNQGRLAEAQDGFRRALLHNPAHIGARQGLFGLLLDAKKNGEAEQLLQEGLKLNPSQPAFAMALASLQYERSDIAGAIETMQKSAPAAQTSPDYLARLAGLLQRQSRHREAVESYQGALRLTPGSGVWMMGLGISLQAMNRNGEAQDAFRRAKASNTLNPELQAFVDQRLKQLQ